jgi:hypothetical protein
MIEFVEFLIGSHVLRKLVHRCASRLCCAGHVGAEQNACCPFKQFCVIG